MNKLLLVEFRRFFARDIVRLFGLILIGGIVLITIGSFLSSVPMAPGQAAEADREIRASRTNMEDQVRQCRKSQASSIPMQQVDALEQQGASPELVERLRRDAERERTRRECLAQLQAGGNGRLVFARAYGSSIQLAIFPMALMSLAIGASLAGAEWTTGTVTTQLTWEPRRLRLFAVKVLAAALGILAAFVVVEGLIALSLMPGTLARGTFAGVDRWCW